ncbi:MAG: hypothetical protein GF364_05250 [Candidatus Lokiarchaeota archaeon]|nr:hypothetical protein [Candidatus Lokiarchaeota archaeon]
MNQEKIRDILEKTKEGNNFLTKFPKCDILIKESLDKREINRILEEYPGFLDINDFESDEKKTSISVITAIGRKIGPNGYPKIKIYYDVKDGKIVRSLLSK